MDLIELGIVAAPIFIGIPSLAAAVLAKKGAIMASPWTWAGFTVFCLLACTLLASLVDYLVTMPLSWQSKYSGLVIAPIAFIVTILAVKRGVRITTPRAALVRWSARTGAVVLGLFFAVVWLFNLLGYKVH